MQGLELRICKQAGVGSHSPQDLHGISERLPFRRLPNPGGVAAANVAVVVVIDGVDVAIAVAFVVVFVVAALSMRVEHVDLWPGPHRIGERPRVICSIQLDVHSFCKVRKSTSRGMA